MPPEHEDGKENSEDTKLDESIDKNLLYVDEFGNDVDELKKQLALTMTELDHLKEDKKERMKEDALQIKKLIVKRTDHWPNGLKLEELESMNDIEELEALYNLVNRAPKPSEDSRKQKIKEDIKKEIPRLFPKGMLNRDTEYNTRSHSFKLD